MVSTARSNQGRESCSISGTKVSRWLARCRWSRATLIVCIVLFIYFTTRSSSSAGETIIPATSHLSQIQLKDNGARPVTRHKPTPRPVHYITVQVSGRIGNVMFLYASMMGIGIINGLTPAFPDTHYLRQMFHISARRYEWKRVTSWKKFREARACAYESRVEKLPATYDVMELNGFFQSWKYFDRFRDDIRQEFRFQQSVLYRPEEFLAASLNRTFGVPYLPRGTLLVGIHVRLGDMAHKYSFGRGYTVANSTYIAKAIDYFHGKHDPNKILFVVCSDEIEWCEHNINPHPSHVVFSKSLIDAEDMALLTMCNHTIITVGSFGWWGAYLGPPGAITIYYNDFPRPNSSLWFEFESKDYFYPTWIGMSN